MTVTVSPVFRDDRFQRPFAFTARGGATVLTPRFHTAEQADTARTCFLSALAPLAAQDPAEHGCGRWGHVHNPDTGRCVRCLEPDPDPDDGDGR